MKPIWVVFFTFEEYDLLHFLNLVNNNQTLKVMFGLIFKWIVKVNKGKVIWLHGMMLSLIIIQWLTKSS